MSGASVLKHALDGRWDVLKTPLTSGNAASLEECPQVNATRTHSLPSGRRRPTLDPDGDHYPVREER